MFVPFNKIIQMFIKAMCTISILLTSPLVLHTAGGSDSSECSVEMGLVINNSTVSGRRASAVRQSQTGGSDRRLGDIGHPGHNTFNELYTDHPGVHINTGARAGGNL